MRLSGRVLLGIAMAIALVLCVVAGSPAARAAAPSAAPQVSFSLSISYEVKVSGSRTARFKGMTTHVPARSTVQVQQRTASGTWRTVATTATGGTGAYAGTFAPGGLGPTAFRARLPASGTGRAVESPIRTVTVAQFFWLDTISLAHPVDGFTSGPITAPDGQVFAHAFVMDGAAVRSGDVTALWTVGGHCSKVFALVALPKGEDGLVAVVGVGDGRNLFSAATVADGGFDIIQTPVSGASRLALTTSIRKAGTGGQKVDWLSAAVLCSVDPRSL